jgi:biotin operon repressor
MELTTFQAQQLKWLKQQVQNLRDERNSRDPRPRLEQELFAAREELDNYVEQLREHGYSV